MIQLRLASSRMRDIETRTMEIAQKRQAEPRVEPSLTEETTGSDRESDRGSIDGQLHPSQQLVDARLTGCCITLWITSLVRWG